MLFVNNGIGIFIPYRSMSMWTASIWKELIKIIKDANCSPCYHYQFGLKCSVIPH